MERTVKALAAAMAIGLAVTANAATYTVINTNDSGAGSLRDAVAQANLNAGADTIDFAVTGTITLTSGLLRIESGPLTITGPGAANLTIDGNLNSRIFAVIDGAVTPTCPALTGPADYPVAISGLTLRNASRNVVDSAGGAIMTAKTLTLDSMIIRDNFAKGGGGVRVNAQYPGQSLTITNSQFINNVAKATVVGNTGSYNGGALNVSDNCTGARSPITVNVTDTVFAGNRVQPDVLEGRGGAIAIYDNATVALTRVRVYNNGIERPNPPLAFAYPGGGIITTATAVTIIDSEIAENFAQGGGGLSINADNAAFQTPGDAWPFKLINSTVAGNVAFNSGGGIFLWGNVTAEVDNSTIADNLSVAFGSAGVFMSRPGAAGFLAPTLALRSSVLGQARENKGDLSADIAVMPATTVNATNTLIQRVCQTCGLTVTGANNLLGNAPVLAALAFNGGPSRTMAMLAGSPVIDTGSNPLGLATDQRGAGFPRTIGATTDMGAQEGPGLCAGFTDVNSVNAFCPNVEWLKNRAITLGCTSTSVYCPTDPVTRLSMAAFMNRLGTSLTAQKQLVQGAPGALVVPINPPLPHFCITTDFPAATYPRTALVNATISGLADGNAVAWRGFLEYSTDGGASWQVTPTQTATRSYGAPLQWSNAAPVTAFPMAPGLTYRFSAGIRRDNIVAGTTGNFTHSFCQLNAVIVNRNNATSPFDAAEGQDAPVR